MSSALTWSTTNLLNSPQENRIGAYGNGTIVLLSNNSQSDRNLYYSTNNGTSWTLKTVGMLRNVKFLNNIFVGVGRDTTISKSVFTSSDGINWIAPTSYNSATFIYIAYGNNIFVALSFNKQIIIGDNTGTTWTTNSITLPTNIVSGASGIIFSDSLNKFIVVGYTGIIYSSPDGINWTFVSNGPNSSFTFNGGYYNIVYGNNKYIIGAYDSATRVIIYTSPDLTNWQAYNTNITTGYFSLFFFNNYYIAYVASQYLYQSTDGTNWSNVLESVSGRSPAYGLIVNNKIYFENATGSILTQTVINVPTSFSTTYGNATFSLNATTNNNETAIVYNSTNTSIAAVNSSGNITIGNVGTANITLTQANTASYTSGSANTIIVVNRALPTLSIQNFNLTYQTPAFSIFPNIITNNKDTPAPTYTYNSTNITVANIVSNILTIGNVGTANISINQSITNNYLPVNANITVTVSQLQSNLNYTVPSNIKYKDASFNLRANTNVNGATIIYNSSNPLIANVTSSGNVIVGNVGTANINLTIQGTNNYSSVSANILITVNPIQSNIIVPISFTRIYGNAPFNLTATTNNTETPIQYTSGNTQIATVDSNGIVTLGNVGNAQIQLYQPTTTNYTTFTANTMIYVNKANPTLSIQNFNLVFQTPAFSILPNILTNNTDTPAPTYTYSSTTSNVANIVTGVLTIGNAGTANIRISQSATTNYLSANANIIINVSQLQSTLNYTVPSNIAYKDPSFNLFANTNVNGVAIRYSAINPMIANVTSTGNVIIGNAGTANINLTIQGTTNYSSVSANIQITVNQLQANLNYPAISSITKNYKDTLFSLNANTTNTDSTQIGYFTDNAIVANINAFGNITIGNAGTANITLTGNQTTNYNYVTANILITVNRIQANLGYPNSSYNKNYLDTVFSLNANTTNTDNPQIAYTTDNAFVATVNAFGNVTTGNVGTANIMLTRDQTTNYNSVTANILITVNPIQANLNYPANSSLIKNYLDATFNLNANTTNKDSNEIVYSTDNSTVADINVTGDVIIGNAGTANITLIGNSTNNYFATIANIAIRVAKLQSTITVPSSFTTIYGNTDIFNLGAVNNNNTEADIVYTVINPSIATIFDQTGNVIAGNAGTTHIQLFLQETANYLEVTANTIVRVLPKEANITVSPSFTSIYGNAPFPINVTTNNSETPVVYSSSNPIVANVVNGIVTIGNVGSTIITMTQGNTTNYSSTLATSIIYVNRKQATITVDPVYNKLSRDVSFQLMATTNNGETPIQYTPLDTNIVTVVGGGKVIIGNVGNTVIELYQPETTNYLSVSANTVVNIINNTYQKVTTLIELQELVNSGKTFYVKTDNNYTNIVVSIVNK